MGGGTSKFNHSTSSFEHNVHYISPGPEEKKAQLVEKTLATHRMSIVQNPNIRSILDSHRSLEPKKCNDSFIEMMEQIGKSTAVGGLILSWIDECAALSAWKHSETHAVTVSMDDCVFHRSVKAGDIILLKSQVNRTWNTSMEVGVRIELEDPLTGLRYHVASTYLSFVARQNGKSVRIPTVIPATSPEKRRYDEAEKRYVLRKQRSEDPVSAPLLSPRTRGVHPSASYVELCRLVMHSDINPMGTCFGGRVMEWIHLAASMASQRHCKSKTVLVSLDDIHFLAPSYLGEVLTFRAQVNCAFNTTIEVGILVTAEDPTVAKRFLKLKMSAHA